MNILFIMKVMNELMTIVVRTSFVILTTLNIVFSVNSLFGVTQCYIFSNIDVISYQVEILMFYNVQTINFTSVGKKYIYIQ